jgi:hypothetical protein
MTTKARTWNDNQSADTDGNKVRMCVTTSADAEWQQSTDTGDDKVRRGMADA